MNNVSFLGIRPPHMLEGIVVYPINKDLSMSDINNCLKAICPEAKIGSGCNGDVFTLGMDLVVKKARPDALVNKSLMNEAEKLDILYNFEQERGMKLNNVQSGIAGFEFCNGKSYLISTKVEGKKADFFKNPFNEKNLASLLEILTEFDKGSVKNGRLMIYDVNLDNIHITKDNAGIFDFEYMDAQNLLELLVNRIKRRYNTASPHVSDTSNLESNVRSFEYAGLYYYLRDMPKSEIKKFFTKYLEIKSKYHKDMSDYYFDLAKELKYFEFYNTSFLNLAKNELSHSKLLAKADDDIIKAEAMKIQMANSVFVSSKWCQTPQLKFNPEQIKKYYMNCLEFFKKRYYVNENTNIDKQNYYRNCINLTNGWKHSLSLPDNSRVTNEEIKTLDEFVYKT